ncbi:response regulator [Rufibacter tibetensis]|uniref:Chemotaxis protein CheY n=1 Tax=Rufibacter tibetensis TaxID=512763 RepID=A0A0P0CUJ9_9BACT|nr:response regulator [Rufibacter tibetensis]ALJ00306.1 chemotaxis protein CheY [Rufibacter tibetensis]
MNSKHAHILLVEDDPVDVATTKRAFQAKGVENPIHVAPNGKVALDMLLGRGMTALSPIPQIILLDLNLPEMGGLEFLKELRKNPQLKACSVFVMTGQGSSQDLLEAYDLNVAGYIVKPLQYSSFVEKIGTLQSFWNLIELPN